MSRAIAQIDASTAVLDTRASFRRELADATGIELALAALEDGRFTEYRICPGCGDDTEHVIDLHDTVESAECIACGCTHDFTVRH